MPTNPNPHIAAIKQHPGYMTTHRDVSRAARDTVTKLLPSRVKQKQRQDRDAERRLVNKLHRIKRGKPVLN